MPDHWYGSLFMKRYPLSSWITKRLYSADLVRHWHLHLPPHQSHIEAPFFHWAFDVPMPSMHSQPVGTIEQSALQHCACLWDYKGVWRCDELIHPREIWLKHPKLTRRNRTYQLRWIWVSPTKESDGLDIISKRMPLVSEQVQCLQFSWWFWCSFCGTLAVCFVLLTPMSSNLSRKFHCGKLTACGIVELSHQPTKLLHEELHTCKGCISMEP